MAGLPEHLFSKPVWHALGTKHRHFAVSTGKARRYPADVAPFVAVVRCSPPESQEGAAPKSGILHLAQAPVQSRPARAQERLSLSRAFSEAVTFPGADPELRARCRTAPVEDADRTHRKSDKSQSELRLRWPIFRSPCRCHALSAPAYKLVAW
jgi:hypothetical protein